MAVTLSGKLPRDASNGLGAIAAQLARNPDDMHVIVALVDCSKIVTDTDTGEVMPTARIRAVEAFADQTEDAAEIKRLLRRALDRRTRGEQFELPLDLEKTLDALQPSPDDAAPEDGAS
jgi:hypothetical protein